MPKTVKRIKARSKYSSRKGNRSRKGAGKSKGPASFTATALRSASTAAFDPAKVEAQTRLEQAAFEQLTPGLSLTAADLSKSIPFVPGLIRFRLLRPEDLLVMEIETTDLEFESQAAQDETGDDAPHLVPSGSKGGLLTAEFGYQHAAEKARFEVNNIPNPPEPGDRIPIAARAAHKSRLVFKVPKGERIAFSIDGILAAMSRLEMVVAPVAMPRESDNDWVDPDRRCADRVGRGPRPFPTGRSAVLTGHCIDEIGRQIAGGPRRPISTKTSCHDRLPDRSGAVDA